MGIEETLKPRGFAALDKATVRAIASEGGRVAHRRGTAHEWTPEEAKAAGRKGGLVSRGGRGRLSLYPPDGKPLLNPQDTEVA